ncbi:hypothetical protein MFIFM68171_04833 [Madurella fahalii]|uniref:Ubiquitin-like protease family profile domain-containing protein n=1 Tax=Madurella fahalii TaxID=1157608 RepID=A0ABQ0GA22_9PEZI
MAKAYLDDFGGSPPPGPRARPRFPSHRDFPNPLRDNDLFDARSPAIDQKLNRVDDERFLRHTYSRALHPVLDEIPEDEELEGFDPKGTFAALEHCHNGLWRARRAEFLEASDVYHLANRLIAWIQDQPGARLGGCAEGKWWIAPDAYVLRAGRISSAGFGAYGGMENIPKLGDPMLAEIGIYGDRSEDKDLFERACFTIHFAHFVTTVVDHWGLLIRQRSTGNTWYIDSNPTSEVPRRSEKALKVFKGWLELSGIADPPEAVHSVVKSKIQIDGWSCGLHVIANAAAFIRFEVLGWERVPYWGRMNSRQMIKRLLKSLHNLMGLAIPADFSPSPAALQKKIRKPEPIPSPVKPSKLPKAGDQTHEEPGPDSSVPSKEPEATPEPSFGTRKAPKGRAIILAARAAEAAEAVVRQSRRGRLAAATPEVADPKTASVKKAITRSATAKCKASYSGTEHLGNGDIPFKKKRKTVSFSSNIVAPSAATKIPPNLKRSAASTDGASSKAKKQKKNDAAAKTQGTANSPPATARKPRKTPDIKRGIAAPSPSAIEEPETTITITTTRKNRKSSTKPTEKSSQNHPELGAPAPTTAKGRKREPASAATGAEEQHHGSRRPNQKAGDHQELEAAKGRQPPPSVLRESSRLKRQRKVDDGAEKEAVGGEGERGGE